MSLADLRGQMIEVEIKDSTIGSKLYVKELALEIVDAFIDGKYSYVFETLTTSPFALSIAVYHLLPQKEDRERFLHKSIDKCQNTWTIDDFKF